MIRPGVKAIADRMRGLQFSPEEADMIRKQVALGERGQKEPPKVEPMRQGAGVPVLQWEPSQPRPRDIVLEVDPVALVIDLAISQDVLLKIRGRYYRHVKHTVHTVHTGQDSRIYMELAEVKP